MHLGLAAVQGRLRKGSFDRRLFCLSSAAATKPSIAMTLRAHDDPVFHIGDARRRPRHALGLLPFDPRSYGSFEDNLAAARFDGDAVGVDLGAMPECILDLSLDSLDVGRLDARSQLDLVADAFDALEWTHCIFSGSPLILPLDLSL
jgi:hypothetical protein